MKKVTKSVIKLSEIPENLQRNKIFIGHKIHTYAIFHIDESEEDNLSLWLIKKYPTIKRKTSFLIHIDIELKQFENLWYERFCIVEQQLIELRDGKDALKDYIKPKIN